MQLELARAHARYNHWMNDRLYALAAELTEEQRTRDVGAFFQSVHLTLHHLVVTDRVWLARFGVPEAPLATDVKTNFENLRAARMVEDQRVLDYVRSLDEAALLAPISYKTSRGVPFTHAQWHGLFQLFNHQTHHRGQATTLLMQLGKDPGVTDLIAFLREFPA